MKHMGRGSLAKVPAVNILTRGKFVNITNMRTALNNPFSPGSDTVPEVWAGRTEQLSDWRDVVRPRRQAGLPERGRTILGEPGLGKSSLVRRIAQEALANGDWATPQLRMPLGGDPLKRVAAALLSLAEDAGLSIARERNIANLLERVREVSIRGIAISLGGREGPEPYEALKDLLVEIGRAAMKADRVAIVHIDEMQNITDDAALSQLRFALGDALTSEDEVTVPGNVVVSRSLPVAVYLTGLPEFADTAGARKGATFARRFKTTVLDALGDDDLLSALQPFVLDGWDVTTADGDRAKVWMDPDAAGTIIDLCKGEPFLFQLAGERSWYAATGARITKEHVLAGWRGAVGEASAHVDRMIERLPEREHRFLEAMAALEPGERTLSAIAHATGYDTPTSQGTIARRLDQVRGIINRGSVYTFRHRAVEARLTSSWPWID